MDRVTASEAVRRQFKSGQGDVRQQKESTIPAPVIVEALIQDERIDLATLHLLRYVVEQLEWLGAKVTELSNQVATLDTDVQAVADFVATLQNQSGTITTLQTALDAANAADVTDKAALAAALADASAAAASIAADNAKLAGLVPTATGAAPAVTPLNPTAPAPSPADAGTLVPSDPGPVVAGPVA